MSYKTRQRIFRRMEIFKNEIYVTWNTGSENMINSLYDYFMQADHEMEIHLFLHRDKLRDNDIIEWPSNFTFHFSSTGTDNALQTSLIAYVLEKFEGISDSLINTEIPRKSKIFFIQKTTDQFEELKAMLVRLPLITEAFSFKLLALNGERGKDFLFSLGGRETGSEIGKKSNGSYFLPRAISENGLQTDFQSNYGNISPRTIRHGRRASDFPEVNRKHNVIKPSLSTSFSEGASPHHNNECLHCDRRKGSKPSFNKTEKNYYCLACFLDGKDDIDLCRNCFRQKNIEMTEKSTTIDRHLLQKNKIVQFNQPEVIKVNASTSTLYPAKTVSVSCQTDNAGCVDFDTNPDVKQLQEKFYAIMGKIESDQNDLLLSNSDKSYENGAIPDDDKLRGHFKDGNTEIRKSSGFRVSDVVKNPRTNKYHCPYCVTKTFLKQEIFEVHLRNVHKKCNCSCDHFFESREDYLDHFYEVFPLFCFETRKCPERFRSIHYQAIHHAQAHFSTKPFHCVPCTYERISSNNSKKVCFKDVESLQAHGRYMLHDDEEMFLRIKTTEGNDNVALTGRANAVNFSG